MGSERTILIVDDDKALLKVLSTSVRAMGYDVDLADGGRAAVGRLGDRVYDILLVDLGMPELDGFEVMAHAIRNGRSRAVVVMTGQDSGRVGARAIQAGACEFVTKPIEPEGLRQVFESALGEENDDALAAWRVSHAPGILGDSERLRRVLDTVRRVAPTECEVLITGESGTGKELFARAVHDASNRAAGPFVAINCAAIPKELMESEIFGHAKGAFTGATERRKGKFAAADGGTLFLDEIGEMHAELQAKFLRVVQEREFTPVGETQVRRADVRIVSATNRLLEERVQQGEFRADLYFRLNVVPIELPSLGDRPSDIPILAEHFVREASLRHGRDVTGLGDDVLALLKSHRWVGNIRELKNIIERVVVLKAESGPVRVTDLPESLQERVPSEDIGKMGLELPETGLDLDQALQRVEQQLTLDALRRTGGNKAKAAKLLGLKRTTLIERLKKLNVEL